MRLGVALIVVATLVAGAAEAASAQAAALVQTPHAQFFQLANGRGRAVVARRGALLVNARYARIRVVDLVGDGRPQRDCNKPGVDVSDTTVEYRGWNIRCRVSSAEGGGPWQVIIRGRGIYASGVARGSLTLDAPAEGRRGRYRIGDGPLRRWPREATTFVLRR